MTSAIPVDAEVIIIGAGISGLRCASLLQKAKVSCIVLEARSRIGGKILTSDRAPERSHSVSRHELGAAWINDSTQDRVWELAKEFCLTPIIQEPVGNVIAQDFDGSLFSFPYGTTPTYASEVDTAQCIAIRDAIQEHSTTKSLTDAERSELDAISFESWVHCQTNNNVRALASAKAWCHAIIGCDPGEVSALFFLDYCRTCGGFLQLRSDAKDGGQHMRLAEGTSAIVEGVARQIKPGTIRLDSQVKAVYTDPSSQTVRVNILHSMDDNEPSQNPRWISYTARRVILSIPTPTYRNIRFSPPLSTAKMAYITATRYSYYVKYLVVFSRPFWRDNGLCGMSQSFIGPVSIFRDTSNDPDYTLTGFIAATPGRNWSRHSQEERKSAVLGQISSVFNNGKTVESMCTKVIESPWMGEEHNGWGCPIPTLPPGGLLSGCWDAFIRPEGQLHFIGNEFSDVWRGYIDGALRTAERGVAEVLQGRVLPSSL